MSIDEDADFIQVNEVLAELGSHFRGRQLENHDPRTLEQFMIVSGVSGRMLGIGNAGNHQTHVYLTVDSRIDVCIKGFANTLCCDMSLLSFASASRFALCWNADGYETDFRLPNSFGVVSRQLSTQNNTRQMMG